MNFFLLDLYFFPLLPRAAHMQPLIYFSWASYSTLIAIVYALQLRLALDPSSLFSSPGINGLVTCPASRDTRGVLTERKFFQFLLGWVCDSGLIRYSESYKPIYSL